MADDNNTENSVPEGATDNQGQDTQVVTRPANQKFVKPAAIAAGIIAVVALVILFGKDCDCKGASSNGSAVTSGLTPAQVKALIKKQIDPLKKQISTLQGTIDAYADCLEEICGYRNCLKRICKKPSKTFRRRRRPPPIKTLPLPPHYSGDSNGDSGCRVIRVSGRTVYTKGCQGWQPLQFGPKSGRQACPGIYYRKLARNGTFTLSAHRVGQNCRNFTLRRGSKWLIITGASGNSSRGLGVSNPSGEGNAFLAL